MPKFAKPETDRPDHGVQPMPLASVVGDIVATIQPQIVAKGLAYRAAVPADLMVMADAGSLREVLLTLLSNAIEFTERGGRITVDVATRETGDDGGKPGIAFVRVSDTGIGIPRHKQESLFDSVAHAQRHGTPAGEGGGLAASRELANRMGGDLRVRSVEGEGSVFTLSLRMPQDEQTPG